MSVQADEIQWTLAHVEDWGGGPEYVYAAENFEHKECGGDVRRIESYDSMGGALGTLVHCAKCDEKLSE